MPPASRRRTGVAVAAALDRAAAWVERSIDYWCGYVAARGGRATRFAPPNTPPGGAPTSPTAAAAGTSARTRRW